MKSERAMERRRFLKGTLGAAGLVALSGCDNLTQSSWFPAPLGKSEKPTEGVQRAVTPSDALAKEYGVVYISAVFPANGNTDPGTEAYSAHLGQNFAIMDVGIGGLGEDAEKLVAGRAERAAISDADHSPRLRRRVERHRETDRSADRRSHAPGRAVAECPLCRIPLCRCG